MKGLILKQKSQIYRVGNGSWRRVFKVLVKGVLGLGLGGGV